MNWPLIVVALTVVCLPLVLKLLAKFADWLESGRLGDWVREQEQRTKENERKF